MHRIIRKAGAFASAILLALLLGGYSTSALADESCRDSELFSGRLMTDICWTCIFPIKVAGIALGGGGSAPPGAAEASFCLCHDPLGVPKPGVTIGMWAPARIYELVRKPGCSLSLGGITLPVSDRRMQGTAGGAEFDEGDKHFYHYHTYAFPLLIMLNLFVDDNCVGDGYFDFDLMFLSELDPTWNNSELAFFTQPEAAAVANPIALAACMADATAATLGTPIDQLFWCAGTWSNSLYPFTGWDEAQGSLAENTNLLAARALAATHRRGLAWRTIGSDAMCGGQIDPIFKKNGYKWSMFYPLSESNGSHVTGESDYRWGSWRNILGLGNDTSFILWRWTDCCSSFM
ncbi:TraU family protein [Azospirillum sp. SYSU D00513]|uniref:TraU family protein n=1 Tax=Azospirillum sp. SYSU D00513 TaxID=2812561 RepID=UPI001A95E1FB|nr:TraU family protein [Azospirillum sp. SYSU D00513]